MLQKINELLKLFLLQLFLLNQCKLLTVMDMFDRLIRT